MTSMISPFLYATQMATKAQESLHTASATLNGPRPMHAPKPGDIRIGIPEHNGPDSPDNPWFIKRPGTGTGIYGVAATHARSAVASIDSAMSYGQSFFSADVRNAFARARTQAVAGVTQLTSPTLRPIDPSDVALQFDTAGLWLGLAKNLIQLEDGRVVARPPVTTLPVPTEPHPVPEIEAPEAMLPEPITIQLPHPDSPVQ